MLNSSMPSGPSRSGGSGKRLGQQALREAFDLGQLRRGGLGDGVGFGELRFQTGDDAVLVVYFWRWDVQRIQ